MANKLGVNGYNSDNLKNYTPIILFNMYDGFFIQSKFYNVENDKFEYGLKPYEYYSCRYVKDDKYDFIVNYTLDNYMKISGKVNGEYVEKFGFLIDITKIDSNSKSLIDARTKYFRNLL